MQDPVDDGLTRLATMPVPRALDRVEASVFDTIADNVQLRRAGRTVGRWSVIAALALGIVGGTAPVGRGARAHAASPIGIDGTLAPSTLLLGR